MKKAIISYTSTIWFKLTNDKLTRNEAIFLAVMTCGVTLMVLHLTGVDLKK